MGVRMVFRCEHCTAQPDAITQRALLGQLHHRTGAEYLDAQPAGWLVWTAGGPLGGRRYACPRHRDDLVDHVRAHYGAICPAARRNQAHRQVWPDGFSALDDHELTALLSGDHGATGASGEP